MESNPDANGKPKIARAYVATADQRETIAKTVGLKMSAVRCAEMSGENIHDAGWTLRKGELLAVFGLEAFGKDRHQIAAAVAWVQGQGADVFEIASGEVAGNGVLMMNRALTRIHGEGRMAKAHEMQRASAKARTINRMPEDEARQHWANIRLKIPQALAKMPGWNRQSAYNTFGKRGIAPGRPKKNDGGKVYFIRANGKGAVKIGYATDVKSRLSGLQTSHRHKLAVVGVISGSRQDEKDFHKRFAHHRISGEWFNCKGDLLEFLATVPKWDGKS